MRRTRPARSSAAMPRSAVPGVVGHDGEIGRPLLHESLEQHGRHPRLAEPADQDGGTVMDPGHRFQGGRHPLVDHAARPVSRSGRPRTPLR